jgi:predicted MFS family arabinose efflux permease
MLATTANTYRNAYSGLSKSTWLLSLIMLINRSGTMVVPFMTLYLTTKMGFTLSQAGVVFGLFGAGAFSGAWLGGRLTDKIGFYPIQLMTLTGGGILFILLGEMRTYPLICTFTFLLSFVNEAFRPANSTAIAFYSKEENRTRSYALNRLAINLGWSIGSALGGFIAHISYELLFWVDGATNITAALLMWVFLKPVNYKPPSKKNIDAPLVQSVYKDKTYLLFAGITILFASCFFQLFTNLPVYFKRELHFAEPLIGFLMSLNGIIIVLVEMIMIYKLDGKRKNMLYISLGVLMVGLSFLLLNLPGPGVMIATCMIISVTIGEMFAMPFMNSYWIARTQPGNRGQYAALFTMAWSAAQVLGPMGGAQIAHYYSFHLLWWIIGGVAIIASLCFWQLYKKN